MHLTNIHIKNYRLLVDANLEVDEETTLIVGRNNSAKTSCFTCLETILKDNPSFSFDDYPLSKREGLYNKIRNFLIEDLTFDDLQKQIENISVEFTINYASEGDSDNLGALSPFIIDIDENTITAIIRAEYKLIPNETNFKEKFTAVVTPSTNISYDMIRDVLFTNFDTLFELKIFAINPTDYADIQEKNIKELLTLFPYHQINAERILNEKEEKKNPLNKLLSNYLAANGYIDTNEAIDKAEELKSIISATTNDFQKQSNMILSQLVNHFVGFGYPNAENLQLGVSTKLNIDEQIKSKTSLTYKSQDGKENLPANYNGLGYQNLIKIEFEIAMFATTLKQEGTACIPILLIEEPEAHLHPQMQTKFAEFLNDYLNKLSTAKIQTFLTTHSAHIANATDFSKIRYTQKSDDSVIYKNLGDFKKNKQEIAKFVHKYLTLTKCDLFFADKVILVEGASERILLPDMICKYEQNLSHPKISFPLSSQYYTIIEIGGAHSHKLIPFIRFLNMPCLIITDIDSVARKAKGKGHAKSVSVDKGETTSNATIKWWVQEKNIYSTDAKDEVNLSTVLKMNAEDKNIENCHLEFQTREGGLCGSSLEEAIRNVNRTHFGLDANLSDDTQLKFKAGGKYGTKTDFAIGLVTGEYNYSIPEYIKNGIEWLTSASSYC